MFSLETYPYLQLIPVIRRRLHSQLLLQSLITKNVRISLPTSVACCGPQKTVTVRVYPTLTVTVINFDRYEPILLPMPPMLLPNGVIRPNQALAQFNRLRFTRRQTKKER